MKFSIKSAAQKDPVAPKHEEIPTEILAVITAAATAFLGTNFRIGPVRQQHPAHETLSRWTEQGRKLVEASHNLRIKR